MTYEAEAEIVAVMEEPPGGPNHGRLDGYTLDTQEMVTLGFRYDGGFGVTDEGHGGTKGNPGGHINHPDVYVDADALRAMALAEFGFTADQVESVYHTKKIKAHLTQLRARMDARMLSLRRSGANMYRFAEAVGLNQRTMNRALVRAEEAEGS